KSYRAALERAFASGKRGELAKTLARTTENVRPPPPPGPPPPAPPSPPPVAEVPPVVEAAAPTPIPATPTPPPIVPRDPDREQKLKLLAKIREAEGREAVTRAVEAFLGRYPRLPDDFEILTKCLHNGSDDRVRDTLAQLTMLMEKDKPRRARTLAASLRILEDTHGDPEIRAHAGRVRSLL